MAVDLDFAYRYPFSKEAKQLISESDGSFDERLLRIGRIRLEEDLNSEEITFRNTSIQDIKRSHVLSYVYSRMLISAVSNRSHLERYIRSEARRARGALEADTLQNILRLIGELGLEMGYSDERFIISFTKFLDVSAGREQLALVKQDLDKGTVHLSKESAMLLVESAVAKEIRKKLPIAVGELPKRIIDEAKTVKLPKLNIKLEIREGSYRWIEKILSNPIADVRHRTVNLILAPYLTNVKGLSEDDAASIILEYIERCKQINPDTRVNSSYVKYQCKYAKAKGLRPMSFERARDLYAGVIDLD